MDPNIDVFNLTLHQLFDYIQEELAIPIGERAIRTAIENGQISGANVVGNRLYSRQEVLTWLQRLGHESKVNAIQKKRAKARRQLEKIDHELAELTR